MDNKFPELEIAERRGPFYRLKNHLEFLLNSIFNGIYDFIHGILLLQWLKWSLL